jgi:hypothetical protein
VGIRATYKKLEPPAKQEGYDVLYEVKLVEPYFDVQEIQ